MDSQRENGIGFGKLLKRPPLYILGPFLCVLPLCLHISATPSSKPICEWLLNRTMRLEPRFIRCRSKWFGCQVSPSADKRKRTARSTGSVLNVCTVTRWPHWTERNGNTFDLINWIFRCHWGQSRYFLLVLGATSFAAYQCLCMCVCVLCLEISKQNDYLLVLVIWQIAIVLPPSARISALISSHHTYVLLMGSSLAVTHTTQQGLLPGHIPLSICGQTLVSSCTARYYANSIKVEW